MAKKLHRTYRGAVIDMDALVMLNEQQVAVGNANMNARGDILGNGGIIKKTNEQIIDEYYQQQVRSQVQMQESPAVYKPKVADADVVLAPQPKRRSQKKG